MKNDCVSMLLWRTPMAFLRHSVYYTALKLSMLYLSECFRMTVSWWESLCVATDWRVWSPSRQTLIILIRATYCAVC